MTTVSDKMRPVSPRFLYNLPPTDFQERRLCTP